MNRRGFLKRLGIGAAVLPAVALLPRIESSIAKPPTHIATSDPHRLVNTSMNMTSKTITNGRRTIVYYDATTVYAFYNDDGAHTYRKSTDNGYSWSEPVRVG